MLIQMHIPVSEASYPARAGGDGPTSSMCDVAFPRGIGFSFPPVLTKAKGIADISIFHSGGRGGRWKLITSHVRSVSKCLRGSRQGDLSQLLFCKSSVFFHGERFEGKIDSQGCELLCGTYCSCGVIQE